LGDLVCRYGRARRMDPPNSPTKETGMNDDQVWPAGGALPGDRERFARYAEALAFYQGEQWLGWKRRGSWTSR
jgi:hypothetical protein